MLFYLQEDTQIWSQWLIEFLINFIVKPYIAQLDMFQHTDVFITHAGMNSTTKALYYNVPLVMFQLTLDQPLEAYWVQKLGTLKIALPRYN